MKLIYLCYWGIDEGLTQATVLPHLEILSSFEQVESIFFYTVERASFKNPENLPNKVHFEPICSKNYRINLLNKVNDIGLIVDQISTVLRRTKIDLFIGRSSLAGTIGYKIHRKFKLPYVVESFEPHADYMLEAGVWKAYDPRYLFQKKWEKKQKETALFLVPVAENYKQKLKEEGVQAEKLIVGPCCVKTDKFRFSDHDRDLVRSKLHLTNNAIVGIYVGKFGGIYFDLEAFQMFKRLIDGSKDVVILLLTPNEHSARIKASHIGIPEDRLKILFVKHNEVPAYLSASDFALSLHTPSESKKYVSPIKNGEYWANGLPIIISNGIGDDSQIIHENNVGIVADSLEEVSVESVLTCCNQNKKRALNIEKLANQHRSFDLIEAGYQKILNKIPR